MKHIKKFDTISENYGGEEAHKDDFGTTPTGWDAVKKDIYTGSRKEEKYIINDDDIDHVINLMKEMGYNAPTKDAKKSISTKGTYPGSTNL